MIVFLFIKFILNGSMVLTNFNIAKKKEFFCSIMNFYQIYSERKKATRVRRRGRVCIVPDPPAVVQF